MQPTLSRVLPTHAHRALLTAIPPLLAPPLPRSVSVVLDTRSTLRVGVTTALLIRTAWVVGSPPRVLLSSTPSLDRSRPHNAAAPPARISRPLAACATMVTAGTPTQPPLSPVGSVTRAPLEASASTGPWPRALQGIRVRTVLPMCVR
jgi:hypothetical protein